MRSATVLGRAAAWPSSGAPAPEAAGDGAEQLVASDAPAIRTVICTLGMHRSGTSLVARLLNLLGVHLGRSPSVANCGDDNPKGYWEHHPLTLINDEILVRFGGRWNQPPAFPAGWWREPRLEDLRAKARHLLHEEFATEGLWGWKDPRTCLTLPFWQQLTGPFRYVICVRNPCEVVASLSRRDAMTADVAQHVWLRHVQSSLAYTSGQPRLFVFYDEIIGGGAAELRRLAAFIGRAEAGDAPGVQAAAADFLERELCHHRMSLADLAGDRHISFPVKSLYLALKGHAPRAGAVDGAASRADRLSHTTVNLLAVHAGAASERMAALSGERERMVQEQRAQAAAIASLSAERDRLQAEARAVGEHVSALSTTADALAAREASLRESVAMLEAGARVAAAERDRLMMRTETDAVTLAELTAERQDLAARAGGLGAELVQRYAECRARATREQHLLEQVLRLESGLQAALDQRDREAEAHATAVRTLQQIDSSSAWRLVSWSRRVLAVVLPAGSRRGAMFQTLLRRLTRRLASPHTPCAASTLRTS